MAPFALVGPILARFLDAHRGGLRTAMFVSSVGRAVLALYLGPRIDSLWLIPIAFGMLVLSRAQVVVRGALLPHVVPKGRGLVHANSSLFRASALAGVVGALPGVALLQLSGVRTELLFTAVVYAIGAPAAFGLPRARGRRSVSERTSARAGVRALPVRQAVVAAGGMRLIVGFLVFHLAFALRREEFGNIGLGLLIGGATLGGFLGALTAPRMRRVLKEEGMLALGLFLAAAAGIVGGLWFSLAIAVALVILVGLGAGASKLAFDSIVQREIEEAGRGYAFARFESILQLAWVAGGFIAVAIPIPSGPGVAGAGVIGLVLMALYVAGRSKSRSSEVA
jgi:cyanate permease